jgi:hypothetical protein
LELHLREPELLWDRSTHDFNAESRKLTHAKTIVKQLEMYASMAMAIAQITHDQRLWPWPRSLPSHWPGAKGQAHSVILIFFGNAKGQASTFKRECHSSANVTAN